MSPRMSRGNVSIAANSVSANQLAGELYEFVGPAMITLAAAAAAVGVRTTLLIGGVAVCNDQDVSQANRFPILPDDLVTSEQTGGGRLVLTFRNTTGAAIVVNWSLDVDPLR